MTVPHPQSWRAPPKQQTPPGALPHFQGPFTCEMASAMPLREGAPVPQLMYAALLSRAPDADGYNFVEIEGGCRPPTAASWSRCGHRPRRRN